MYLVWLDLVSLQFPCDLRDSSSYHQQHLDDLYLLDIITQYYIDITILLNITYILGSIQFNTPEYYTQYYSILHAKEYNTTQYYMHIG